MKAQKTRIIKSSGSEEEETPRHSADEAIGLMSPIETIILCNPKLILMKDKSQT
jgi:hypothetical protein